jgi:predicted metal-dependent hydrolase
MATKLRLGDQTVDVAFKDIKNVHLSVHPPAGRVSISAPRRMKLETVRLFAISKLDWIRRQQRKIRGQEREPEREFVDRESHCVWGKRYLLSVVEQTGRPAVELRQNKLLLTVPANAKLDNKRALVELWYRNQIRELVPTLVSKWEPVLGVKVGRVLVRRMKTRWGSCNHRSASILLNTELAKKPRACLEYVLVHEMVHLLEPTHNARFVALMDRFMPMWKTHRQALNRLPLRHEEWDY